MKDAVDNRNDMARPHLPGHLPGRGPEVADLKAMALASEAAAGHFNELAGRTASDAAADKASAAMAEPDALAKPASVRPSATMPMPTLTPAWTQFFDHLDTDGPDKLDQRATRLERQVRDNGVTYNVYADESGPQRPWSLDLFPMLVESASWQRIEAGITQRMRLLERVMRDVYGPQELLNQGLLPPALVQGHPGYMRAMHGVRPVGGNYLHLAAFDMARGSDGNWWIIGQRLQSPSGLGYLLENRLAISNQFPQAFQAMRVQRLAGTYRALMDSLRQASPAGQDSHLALLTPGPYNETYFEHVYLARYLGLTLVEGNDLIVRDQALFLKTLKGLVRVHGLLKRVDDQFLDPLELRPDSSLGVPGLLQAIRAGNVLVANAPGSAFLESPALLGFFPALSQHLLGEDLLLPSLPTWWCGERSAMDEALPQLRDCVIKPTYPDVSGADNFDAVLCKTLPPRGLDEWAGRIVGKSDEHTVQAFMPFSQMPTWRQSTPGGGPETGKKAEPAGEGQGDIVLRSAMLRVFAVSDAAQGWRVLPGGLARLVSAGQEITSMQRGGSSADVWALTQGTVDQTTLLQPQMTPESLIHRKWMVTSRAAENLFWMGRYTERAENAVRLARVTLECLNGEDQSSVPLLEWLSSMAVTNTLVLPGVPSAVHARRIFERSLISSLGSTKDATSVGYHLRALKMAGSCVRERLSQEHWRMIVRAEEDLLAHSAEYARDGDYSSLEALRVLKNTSNHLAAITGAQADRMTRDDGWRLLSIGRQIERLSFLSTTLASAFSTGSVHTLGGFEALISTFDSSITFHAQFQQSREVAALIALLVLDADNPRSLAWVIQTLRGRLSKLAGNGPRDLSGLAQQVPDPQEWDLATLCETHRLAPKDAAKEPAADYYFALNQLLIDCTEAALNVSDDISTTYFTHSGQTNQSLLT